MEHANMNEKSLSSSVLAFSMKGICKSFGSVLANDNIHFDVRKGEIHALLGENGSGKSTLMPDASENMSLSSYAGSRLSWMLPLNSDTGTRL